MKTTENKLVYKKKTIIDLQDEVLVNVNGGGKTEDLPSGRILCDMIEFLLSTGKTSIQKRECYRIKRAAINKSTRWRLNSF